MIIYADKISPRLRYVADFLARNLFDEDVIITNDQEQAAQTDAPVIAYSKNAFTKQHFHIRPAGLLDETATRPQHIECIRVNGHAALFPTGCDLSFD
ncbi:MAG TPA: hypothetical protein VGC95_12915, partial [Chitinophagaceae bacterium]